MRPIPDRAVTFVGTLEGWDDIEQTVPKAQLCGTVFPMETEIWRPVVGFPGFDVSDLGRVRSLTRPVQNYVQPGKLLKPYIKRNRFGHIDSLRVTLGRGNYRYIHRLVLEAFVGPAPEGLECCHGDGDPQNNRLDNLRWDTHAANMADKVAHGTGTKPPIFRGEAHPQAKLTASAVRAIRAAIGERPMSEIAEEFSISHMTVRRIRDRTAWAHV